MEGLVEVAYLFPLMSLRVVTVRFVPVAFVNVIPVDETVPKIPAFVTDKLPIPKLPDPVAFVNVVPCRVVMPTTCRVEDGCKVPTPSQLSALSQNKSGVLDTVELVFQ